MGKIAEFMAQKRDEGWTFNETYDAPLNAMYRDSAGTYTRPDGSTGTYEIKASRLPDPKPWVNDPGDMGYEEQYPGVLYLDKWQENALCVLDGDIIPADPDPDPAPLYIPAVIAALFAGIDTAKDHADYGLANILFARLLRAYLGDGEENRSVLRVELETRDESGVGVQEAYYDLVVVRCGELSACLPLPLLSPEAVATLFKRGIAMVERQDHNRSMKVGENYGDYNREDTFNRILEIESSLGAWYNALALLSNDLFSEFESLLPPQQPEQETIDKAYNVDDDAKLLGASTLAKLRNTKLFEDDGDVYVAP